MSKLASSVLRGTLRIGKWIVQPHVLSDGKRVLTSSQSYEIVGDQDAKVYQGLLNKIASHPPLRGTPATVAALSFLQPILFIVPGGELLEGVNSESITAACRLILRGREYGVLKKPSELRVAQAAESLIVSLADVGLAALIDEATGAQATRDRDALQALLDRYLLKEHAVWAKRFPDEFYMQIFRLHGWNWKGMKVNRPGIVGTYTKDIVYARLGAGILTELEQLNPQNSAGHRENKHHQFLTDDIGHPALSQHIYAVMALMRGAETWSGFRRVLKKSFPRKGDQLDLLDLSESDLE